MIQNIAPAQFSVSYDLRTPQSDSILCTFHGASVLGSMPAEGTLALPRFCELNVPADACWFLFFWLSNWGWPSAGTVNLLIMICLPTGSVVWYLRR